MKVYKGSWHYEVTCDILFDSLPKPHEGMNVFKYMVLVFTAVVIFSLGIALSIGTLCGGLATLLVPEMTLGEGILGGWTVTFSSFLGIWALMTVLTVIFRIMELLIVLCVDPKQDDWSWNIKLVDDLTLIELIRDKLQ